MKVNPSPSTFLPGFDRRTASAVLVLLFILILAAALFFVFRVSAAGPDAIDRLMPTVPPAAEVTRPTQSPSPADDLRALQEALAAAEAERDALRIQLQNSENETARLTGALSDAVARNQQLIAELDELRIAQETCYTLRFRAERKTLLPGFSEILSFTVTVDEETYNNWNNGDPVTGDTDFLSIPADGPLHEWTVVMEEKSVTSPAENP